MYEFIKLMHHPLHRGGKRIRVAIRKDDISRIEQQDGEEYTYVILRGSPEAPVRFKGSIEDVLKGLDHVSD
jgi:3-deoxy-D-arabino-heptulosonate 7-phosphate (DAHP) synthase